ncbi:hypothetical protein SUBVAR_06353, partial [Subdoligranulum variabile DSM 15176]
MGIVQQDPLQELFEPALVAAPVERPEERLHTEVGRRIAPVQPAGVDLGGQQQPLGHPAALALPQTEFQVVQGGVHPRPVQALLHQPGQGIPQEVFHPGKALPGAVLRRQQQGGLQYPVVELHRHVPGQPRLQQTAAQRGFVVSAEHVAQRLQGGQLLPVPESPGTEAQPQPVVALQRFPVAQGVV